jgi:hypothetical protein
MSVIFPDAIVTCVITPPYGPVFERSPVNVPETLFVVGAGVTGACVAAGVFALLLGVAVDLVGAAVVAG